MKRIIKLYASEIEYSTDSKFKKSTVVKAGSSKKSANIKGLKKGKTYYVRVKSYKKYSSGNNYSPVSKTVKVKVTK